MMNTFSYNLALNTKCVSFGVRSGICPPVSKQCLSYGFCCLNGIRASEDEHRINWSDNEESPHNCLRLTELARGNSSESSLMPWLYRKQMDRKLKRIVAYNVTVGKGNGIDAIHDNLGWRTLIKYWCQNLKQRYSEDHLQYLSRSQIRVRMQRQNESLQELESDIENMVQLA